MDPHFVKDLEDDGVGACLHRIADGQAKGVGEGQRGGCLLDQGLFIIDIQRCSVRLAGMVGVFVVEETWGLHGGGLRGFLTDVNYWTMRFHTHFGCRGKGFLFAWPGYAGTRQHRYRRDTPGICRRCIEAGGLSKDPVHQLQAWIEEATNAGESDPTAMTVSSLGEGGCISSRVVLLKGIDHNGLRFFTNTKSQKSTANCWPFPSFSSFLLALPSPASRRRGEGRTLPREVVAEYFAQRPRDSQYGAWASSQSEPVPNRQYLEDAYFQCVERFSGTNDIPVPPDWGGFHIAPPFTSFGKAAPAVCMTVLPSRRTILAAGRSNGWHHKGLSSQIRGGGKLRPPAHANPRL